MSVQGIIKHLSLIPFGSYCEKSPEKLLFLAEYELETSIRGHSLLGSQSCGQRCLIHFATELVFWLRFDVRNLKIARY